MLLDTPVCDFGWKAPDFTLEDTNGNATTLQNSMGENGLLIAFICNHCPYVKRIVPRFVHDMNVLQQRGVNVLAVMSNDYRTYTQDSPENMRAFSAQHDFSFPYLIDEHQDVAKAYGAVCTPDFFGFNRSGELQYRGRLDDVRMTDVGERTPELLNAMQHVAASGKGPQHQVPSMGCSIKWC